MVARCVPLIGRLQSCPARRSFHTPVWDSVLDFFVQIPADCVPLEYAALLRELFTAYRLLEDHGSLKARSQSIVGPRV